MEQKSEQAAPKDVGSVDEKFLDCRDLGHNWVKIETVEDSRRKEIRRTVACMNCSTERIQLLDLQGYILRAKYRYVTGYLLDGCGYLTIDDRATLRLRNLRRSIPLAPTPKVRAKKA